MFSLRRSAASSTRRLLRQSPRRFESSSHAHETHGGAHAHHEGPASESFGKGFYIAIAAIPALAALYKFTYSDPSSNPYLQQIISKYSDFKEQWDQRNSLHTNMIEQAAHDRNLFQSQKVDTHVQLRYPEIFNTGSPFNVVAGQGGADLTELIAYYEKKNREIADKNKERYEERELEEARK